jgi:hypothetical protein
MNKSLVALRAQLRAIIDLISEVAGDASLTDKERVLLIRFEIFLGNVVTAINNEILQSQAAVIDSLRRKFAGSASQLDRAHEKIVTLTKTMTQLASAVKTLGDLITKLTPPEKSVSSAKPTKPN